MASEEVQLAFQVGQFASDMARFRSEYDKLRDALSTLVRCIEEPGMGGGITRARNEALARAKSILAATDYKNTSNSA